MATATPNKTIENTHPTIDPLFVDTYVGDRLGDVKALMDAGPPWHGFIHKLTQGTYHDEADRAIYYRKQMLNHPRYGVDFWEGYYHFIDLNQDAVDQADMFWLTMARIGGEKAGTLWAMVDVERGGQRAVPSRQQVFDWVGSWARRYEQLSGRKSTLYGGELLRGLGIHAAGAPINLLGCGRNAIALYGAKLTVGVIEATGTDPAHLLMWQYDGDGEAYLAGYPRSAPGFGPIDISVLTLPGGLPALRDELAQG
jgi:hypothetical protein